MKLGHWWGGRWIADGQVRGEVLLAGEALHLEPKQVFEVLLHEAAHGINAARGVKDTSRGGRYHNEQFAATAREVGLEVTAMPPYGMARTELDGRDRGAYAATIERLGDAMRIARQLQGIRGVGAEQGGRRRRGTDGWRRSRAIPERAGRDAAAAAGRCGCTPRCSLRVRWSVGSARRSSPTGAEVRQEVEPDAEPSTVDTSFGARRREALAAERDQRFRGDARGPWSLIATAIDDPTAGVDGTVGPLRQRLDRIEAAIAALGGEQPDATQLRSGPDDRAVGRPGRATGTRTTARPPRYPMVAADPVELERAPAALRVRSSAATACSAGPTSTSARSMSPSATASSS